MIEGALSQRFGTCRPVPLRTAAIYGVRAQSARRPTLPHLLHFSTAEQLPATFAKHFAGKRDLVVLRAETAKLGDRLRWEPSRGGELFPHVYGELSSSDDIMCVGHMPEGSDGCSFLPDEWLRDGEIESAW